MSAMAVELSSKRFGVPFECPCCGARPDAELRIRLAKGRDVPPESARGLEFPYCERCVAHAAAWESAGVGSSGVMLLGIAAGIIVSFTTRLWLGLIVWVGAVPIALRLASARRARAKAACGPSCAGPGTAVHYLGWTGNVTSLAFESPTYAARFAEHNPSLLVASPALQKLLERHRIARSAVPTPAVAAAIPPPLDVDDWIARLEKAPTRVARRHTLARGLDALAEPAERDQLVAAAVRAELAPVLRDVERAQDANLQRARLRLALAEVRADNLPEPLYEALERALEARLSG